MKVAQRFTAGKPAMTESAKRTTERTGVIAGVFQPSASRTEKSISVRPSAKALGYSHSVRFADAENRLLQQSNRRPEGYRSELKQLTQLKKISIRHETFRWFSSFTREIEQRFSQKRIYGGRS
ncbi:MAG TPA: hypothetical protein VHQ64_10315 [Pyrinomonadaceae bacterium]|nr:hypothetical protein [Pyrinomonadaceae bacterium]